MPVSFFYLALILSGQASRKLDNIRQSPLLMPVLLLTAVSVVIALTQQRPPEMGKSSGPR
jgi:branched-subunit amino acid permease